MGLAGLANGLLPFLVIVPAVLARGSLVHLSAVVLGTVLAIAVRSKSLIFLTLLSLAAYFIEAFALLAHWYPVLVSVSLGIIFSFTLVKGPPMVERFARLEQGRDLSPPIKNYCRVITVLWIAFFVVNTMIASWTILVASKEMWALYNGVLSYGVAATLFVGERFLRRYFVDTDSV